MGEGDLDCATYPALHQALLLLKGLAHEMMQDSGKEGREGAWGGWRKRGVELRVPKQCMLACYPGGGVRTHCWKRRERPDWC
jgi:hypothetical protein